MILQQFRQFADLLAEPALLVDSDGVILEVNRAFRSSNFQRPDKVCGRRLHAIVETDEAQVDEYLRACARRHDVVMGALTFRQVGGQPVWLRCQGGAVCARSDTQPARLLIRLLPRAVSNAAFEAINRQLAESEKQRFENALRTSQQTLQTIFDQAGVGVALVDSRSGRFVRINQRFCDLVGRSVDEMTDTTWCHITHPDDLRTARDNMARLVAGEIREYAMEQRFVLKDGSIVWVNLTVSPTWLPGEQPVRHIAVVEDISDRKQSEEDSRLSGVAFETHDSIVITNKSGRIVRVNKSFTNLTGYAPEDVIGKTPRVLRSGRHGKEFYREMWRAIGTDGYWEGEVWNKRKDGQVYLQRLTIACVKNATGETTHYVGNGQDITEQKRAEADRAAIRAAHAVQQTLFPSDAPRLPGFDVAGAVRPAEHASGDFFDYLPLGQSSVGLLVADVSSHGLGPALVMAQTQAYLHALAESYPDPGELLTQVNRMCTRSGNTHFVTMFLARLDAQTRSFVHASAGHRGYLISSNCAVQRLESRNIPLGIQETTAISSAPAIVLKPDDTLVLPTDGIEEARSRDGRLFGQERIFDVVRNNRNKSAAQIVGALFCAVRDFTQNRSQADDITAVVVKVLDS